MTRDEVSKISPEAQKYCTEIYDQAVQMGPYTPYGMVPAFRFRDRRAAAATMVAPSIRAAAWSSPRRATSRPSDSCRRCSRPTCSRRSARRRCRSTTTSIATAIPCNAPPWAELFGINANTGDIVWRVPLGEYKELTAKGIPKTGTATNTGAPLATAGGVVFIGGTVGRPVPRLRRDDRQGTLVGRVPGFNVGGSPSATRAPTASSTS